MVLMITAMAVMAPPAYRRLTRPATLAEMPILARLTRASDLQWGASQRPLQLGSSLLAGQRLHLAEGWAEVKFARGATVILEAPVDFTLIDGKTARLALGKLSARVAADEAGFVVETPTTKIVDLGTEFGVGHDKAGDSTVHVFEGQVAFSSVDDPRRVQHVRAGEVVRYSKAGFQRVAPQTVPFVRPHEFARLASPNIVADARRDFAATDDGASTFHWQHQGLPGRVSGVWNYYRSRTADTTDARAGLQLLEFMPNEGRQFLMYCCPQFSAHVPAVHNQQMFFHPEHDGTPKSNELSVHPGDENDYGFVVVRWTATKNSPSRVRVQGTARMLGTAPPQKVTGVDFAVLFDGQLRHETAIAPSDNVGTTFDFEADVMPGGHLDFVVGPHGNFSNDQVGLSVQISEIATRGQKPQ